MDDKTPPSATESDLDTAKRKLGTLAEKAKQHDFKGDVRKAAEGMKDLRDSLKKHNFKSELKDAFAEAKKSPASLWKKPVTPRPGKELAVVGLAAAVGSFLITAVTSSSFLGFLCLLLGLGALLFSLLGLKTEGRKLAVGGTVVGLLVVFCSLGQMFGSSTDGEENEEEITAAAPMRGKVQLWAGGPFWATTNIGAQAPEEYGLYFWWGDTVGYRREGGAWVASDGSLQNFSFSEGNTPTYGKSTSTLRSEGWVVSQGGTYVLAPEHDAAHVHWGGNWRIPTMDELSALSGNCDWTWTTRNGVNGYVVSGRGAYSSASIFLPAAGLGDGTSRSLAGSGGYYWSSVPDESSSGYAGGLNFLSGYHGTDYGYRSYGFVVRPVQGFAE